jgi:hypothetical protein
MIMKKSAAIIRALSELRTIIFLVQSGLLVLLVADESCHPHRLRY